MCGRVSRIEEFTDTVDTMQCTVYTPEIVQHQYRWNATACPKLMKSSSELMAESALRSAAWHTVNGLSDKVRSERKGKRG